MLESLELLIRAGNPLIAIETTDEDRATQLVRNVVLRMRQKLFEWSLTSGLRPVGDGGPDRAVIDGGEVMATLEHIPNVAQRTVFVFKDLGPHCKDALVHRTLRDLLRLCAKTKSTLILIDALPLPEEIKRFTIRYEVGWPSAEELEQCVKKTYQKIRDESEQLVTAKLRRKELEQLVQNLRGLSCAEAERVVAAAIYADNTLSADDLQSIVEGKRTLLGSAGCLEAIAADVEPDQLAGLTNLKKWLKRRRGGFSKEAREYGLESPRGMLMLGVPGCGKSLCAKVVASDWKMPLLRLDPGVLYNKFIGETESQLRRALLQAEAMAPVVLWIDEIEKAFASASGEGGGDGGLSKRMFGTLLSWMQDHRHPIFIIATANDISALPPELMRKGRFDEVFFVDLPNQHVREQVLAIHLKRRNRDPANYNLARLAEAAEHFSGSELEQVIVSALFSAFSERRELADEHLLEEIGNTRPLALMMEERIHELRGWAHNRCVSAD